MVKFLGVKQNFPRLEETAPYWHYYRTVAKVKNGKSQNDVKVSVTSTQRLENLQ